VNKYRYQDDFRDFDRAALAQSRRDRFSSVMAGIVGVVSGGRTKFDAFPDKERYYGKVCPECGNRKSEQFWPDIHKYRCDHCQTVFRVDGL